MDLFPMIYSPDLFGFISMLLIRITMVLLPTLFIPQDISPRLAADIIIQIMNGLQQCLPSIMELHLHTRISTPQCEY
jgi:hypothetical protein